MPRLYGDDSSQLLSVTELLMAIASSWLPFWQISIYFWCEGNDSACNPTGVSLVRLDVDGHTLPVEATRSFSSFD